jgi:calcineurin-like phosphoesterase family protein
VALSVLEELRALGPIEAVYGNMDEPGLRESLPKERVLEVEDVRIGLVHIPGPAAGREARLAARFPGCDAVVYGHTHVPQVERFGDVWILIRAARRSDGARRCIQCSWQRSAAARSGPSSSRFRDGRGARGA